MDKTDELFAASSELIDQCIRLFAEQNADSYKAIKAPKLESIKFNPKTSDLFSGKLLQYYRTLMPIVKFVHDCKHALSSMVYPRDEVMIHVDRSPNFVLDLEQRLSERTAQLTDYCEQLDLNVKEINLSQRRHLHATRVESTVDLKHVQLLYQCMEDDFKFIPFGVSILDQLFQDELIGQSDQQEITRLSNALKLKYLSDPSKKDTMSPAKEHLLQSFNLIPSTPNLTLQQVFAQIFTVDIEKVTESNLESVLRNVSKKRGQPISLIIISRHNNDFYYDLRNLFDHSKLSQIGPKSGVTKEYIDTFNVLRSTWIAKQLPAGVKQYNTSPDSQTFVLWTNNWVQFKAREQPVDPSIVGRLLDQRSSDIVDLYNKQFEDKLLNIIQNDTLLSYKQTKYLSFNIDNEETVFIDQLCRHLIKSIKKISSMERLAGQFVKVCQTEFDQFKPFHMGPQASVHALLVYNNTVVRICAKLEKEILAWHANSRLVDQLDGIVRSVVASNDNLYTRFVSSYYLSISA